MTRPRPQGGFGRTMGAFALSVFVFACSSSDSGGHTNDAGSPIGASGGSPGVGGSVGTGGSGSGGAPVGSGGASGLGGKAGLGGSTGLGGAVGTGGQSASGGTSGPDGGGVGGVMSTGGSAASGGAVGTGGQSASGGASGTGGSGSAGSTGTPGDFGFSYRPVQDKQIDWLCTLHKVGPSAYVYVRLDQTGTQSIGIATVPVYTARLAQISVAGAVSDLGTAAYEYGGGHHNDSLQVDYQGKRYKYYHSSFGFGFRQCQPMDCIDIYVPGSTTPETEGCASTRALPEVCVMIKADGTHDPLVDSFKKCAGDSNK